jgi:hypothetical protein
MSINDYERESCVTCGVDVFGVDMCDKCETEATVSCPNCKDLTTPYQMYVDGLCERCVEAGHDAYDREHASLARWYAENN